MISFCRSSIMIIRLINTPLMSASSFVVIGFSVDIALSALSMLIFCSAVLAVLLPHPLVADLLPDLSPTAGLCDVWVPALAAVFVLSLRSVFLGSSLTPLFACGYLVVIKRIGMGG